MNYAYFNSDEKQIASPDKLRLKGGKSVEYQGSKYKIGKASLSTRKGKKYMVDVTNTTTGKTKTVHWGAKGYDDYYVHKDKERRERFQKRHGAIKLKDGRIASEDPTTPAYMATKYNW